MKKIALLSIVASFLLISCNGDKLKQAEDRNIILGDSLQVALAYQDSLFSLLNDINDGMEQIKAMENILSNSGNLNGEQISQKDKIANDIQAIQLELKTRKDKLEELEAKLKKSQVYSSNLKKTIETLKIQIEEQEQTISTLKTDLATANIRIGQLGQQVDSLNSEVTTVTQEKEIAQEESINLANELNTCYYAIGTKKELKEANILESGFLKKTKIMKGNFEQNYFTTADKRSLTSLPTHAKKAKILTNHPADSYEIVEEIGSKVINILNPDKFWGLSNYLVVQVD